MYKAVIAVKTLEDSNLRLTFDDNSEKVFDVKPYLELGLFQDLRDMSVFNTAKISFDTVEWANGADLDPEILFSESTAV